MCDRVQDLLDRVHMSTIRSLLLLHAHCVTTIWTFLYLPHLRHAPHTVSFIHSPNVSNEAGQPLLFTPLIDAGNFDEAKRRSLVQPALAGIESYAGFLTVNRTSRSHLYFWYFPSTEPERTSSPLILWLQGGPGCSSLYGLFAENGPFAVVEGTLQNRKYAWTKEYNVLYVDQPIGTGFSYTEDEREGYVNSESAVSEHLYEALRQFYEVFREMLQRDFYIAGESYAGKYVPALGYKIHTAGRRANAVRIPFKGMMIGNGDSDALNVVPLSEYIYNLGLMEEDERMEMKSIEETVMHLVQSKNWSAASNVFVRDERIEVLSYISIYDYTKSRETNGLGDYAFAKFLNCDQTRASIHTGHIKYAVCSDEVYDAFNDDILQSVRTWVEELLEHYPIMYYNGQFDLICSHPNSKNFLRTLRWSGASEYRLARRQWWHVDDEAAFAYKSGSNLVDVLVRNAGHMVPLDQPKHSLELIRAFIEKKLYNATLQS